MWNCDRLKQQLPFVDTQSSSSSWSVMGKLHWNSALFCGDEQHDFGSCLRTQTPGTVLHEQAAAQPSLGPTKKAHGATQERPQFAPVLVIDWVALAGFQGIRTSVLVSAEAFWKQWGGGATTSGRPFSELPSSAAEQGSQGHAANAHAQSHAEGETAS